jgi:ACS family hexuronate transporter-like MFS transporter
VLLKVILPTLTYVSLRTSIIPFFPELMEKYGVDYAALGALQSSWAISLVLLQIPAGMIADRVSSRFLLPIPFVVLGVLTFVFSQAPNYLAVLAIRALMGAAAAFIFPTFARLLTYAFPVRRGMALGFYESCLGAGFLIALTVMPLVATRTGLAPVFLFLGSSCFVSAYIAFRLAATTGRAPSRAAGFVPAAAPEHGSLSHADSLYGHMSVGRRLIGIILLSFLGALAVDGLLNWLSTYYRLELGYSIGQAAFLMGLTLGSYVLSAFVTGSLSDRLGRIAVTSAGCFLLALSVAGLMNAEMSIHLYAIATLMGIGMAAVFSPIGAIASELFGAGRVGLTTAILLLAAQAGHFTSGVVFGHLIDVTGSFRIIWIITIVCLVARIATAQILSLRLFGHGGRITRPT